MFFTAFLLCILSPLRSFKLEREDQTTSTENLTLKVPNQIKSNQIKSNQIKSNQIKILAYPG